MRCKLYDTRIMIGKNRELLGSFIGSLKSINVFSYMYLFTKKCDLCNMMSCIFLKQKFYTLSDTSGCSATYVWLESLGYMAKYIYYIILHSLEQTNYACLKNETVRKVIKKRRNQKEIPTPKTEVGKNQTNNQALIP